MPPSPRPSPGCGSVQAVLHVALGTQGPWGHGLDSARVTQGQSCSRAGAAWPLPWAPGATCSPCHCVSMTWWCAVARPCQPQLLTRVVAQPLATHPSFPCRLTPAPGLPLGTEPWFLLGNDHPRCEWERGSPSSGHTCASSVGLGTWGWLCTHIHSCCTPRGSCLPCHPGWGDPAGPPGNLLGPCRIP